MSWVEIGDTDEELLSLYTELENWWGCGVSITEQRIVQMRQFKLDCHFYVYTNNDLHACLGIKKATSDLQIYAIHASTNAETQDEFEEIVDAYADKVKAHLQERNTTVMKVIYGPGWAENSASWRILITARFLAKGIAVTDDGQNMILALV